MPDMVVSSALAISALTPAFDLMMGERLGSIDKCTYLVTVFREQARYCFQYRAAGIDHDDAHDLNLRRLWLLL